MTLGISVLSLGLVLVLAVPLGVLAAVRPHGAFDRVTTVLVFVGYSMPSFWLALLCMAFFGVQLRWLPISGVHAERPIDILCHMKNCLPFQQGHVAPGGGEGNLNFSFRIEL